MPSQGTPLSAPVRVTWTLPADPHFAASLWAKIAEARILFAEIHLTAQGLGGLSGLAGKTGRAGAPRLSLVGSADALLSAREVLGPSALAETDLHVMPPFEPEADVEDLAAATRRLIPSLWSSPEEIDAFSKALELATAYGLCGVAILNPRAPAKALSKAERDKVVQHWQERGRPSGLTLKVHDLFLAEALGLDPLRQYAGCQAAGLLAHVDEEGRLLACRTLPSVLGDLRTETVADIWASSTRRTLRERLGVAPEPCLPCGVSERCLGGCRGLSSTLGRDPSCPGLRCS